MWCPTDRIRALSELHAQKVRSLMKSVNSLRGKVKELTRANKNHKRSAHIQALQTQVREHELVVDMLKQLLSDRTGMGRDEVWSVCVLLLATVWLSHICSLAHCAQPTARSQHL